jgi:hypothetical protein
VRPQTTQADVVDKIHSLTESTIPTFCSHVTIIIKKKTVAVTQHPRDKSSRCCSSPVLVGVLIAVKNLFQIWNGLECWCMLTPDKTGTNYFFILVMQLKVMGESSYWVDNIVSIPKAHPCWKH